MSTQSEPAKRGKFGAVVSEPGIAKFLFADTRSAPLWLAVRIWVGLQWLSAGWSHAQLWDFNNGGYIHNGGKSLKAFWDGALAVAPGGTGAKITYDWYYDFLKLLRDGGHYEWFAWVITFGEIAVGLGLIFGCLTGIAAFFGTIMNFSFELAGTTSTNPVLFGAAILLILAWRTSGWWGLDRYILPALGTPWQPGKLFRRTLKTPAAGVDSGQRVPPTGGGVPLA
jgi:thiosulfate dehydrogenase [quinone] large subunit